MRTWIKVMIGAYMAIAIASMIVLVLLAGWFWDVYEFFHA